MNYNYDKDNKERLPLAYYRKIYRGMSPEAIAKRTGLIYNKDDTTFSVELLGERYRISHPDFRMLREPHDGAGDTFLSKRANVQILLLRFMTAGSAAAKGSRFLTFREVPWGEVYFRQFEGRCLKRLAYGFASDPEAFAEAMERMHATKLSYGDISYELGFFGNLKVRLILWAGDDEFPPASQILFSDNFITAFTHGEDLVVAADIILDYLGGRKASCPQSVTAD